MMTFISYTRYIETLNLTHRGEVGIYHPAPLPQWGGRFLSRDYHRYFARKQPMKVRRGFAARSSSDRPSICATNSAVCFTNVGSLRLPRFGAGAR